MILIGIGGRHIFHMGLFENGVYRQMAILTVVIKQWMEWGSQFSDIPYIYIYHIISYYFILNKLRIHLDLETRSVFGKQSAQHATNGERRWGSGMSVEMVPTVIR